MDYDATTLRSVQEYFGLPNPALVEKDFHVVKALAAIAAVEREELHLRLVFGGGTALSRAHRLIQRMSEDIDLRIVVDSNRPGAGRCGGCARGSPRPCSAPGSNSTPTTRPTEILATKPATRSTGCPTSRRHRERGLYARRSRSKRRCGRCTARRHCQDNLAIAGDRP
jgi:hypothetical protein